MLYGHVEMLHPGKWPGATGNGTNIPNREQKGMLQDFHLVGYRDYQIGGIELTKSVGIVVLCVCGWVGGVGGLWDGKKIILRVLAIRILRTRSRIAWRREESR